MHLDTDVQIYSLLALLSSARCHSIPAELAGSIHQSTVLVTLQVQPVTLTAFARPVQGELEVSLAVMLNCVFACDLLQSRKYNRYSTNIRSANKFGLIDKIPS